MVEIGKTIWFTRLDEWGMLSEYFLPSTWELGNAAVQYKSRGSWECCRSDLQVEAMQLGARRRISTLRVRFGHGSVGGDGGRKRCHPRYIILIYIYMSPMFKEYLFTRYQTWHLLSHFFATTTATCVASYRMILLVDGDLERSKSL